MPLAISGAHAWAESLGFVVRVFVVFKSCPDDADSEGPEQLKAQPIMSCEVQLGGSWKGSSEAPVSSQGRSHCDPQV